MEASPGAWGAHSVFDYHLHMLFSSVALMLLEIILRIFLIVPKHYFVSRHLGDDRGCGNGEDLVVSFDDPFRSLPIFSLIFPSRIRKSILILFFFSRSFTALIIESLVASRIFILSITFSETIPIPHFIFLFLSRLP